LLTLIDALASQIRYVLLAQTVALAPSLRKTAITYVVSIPHQNAFFKK